MASSGNGIKYSIVMDAAQVEAELTAMGGTLPRYINSWLVESAIMTKELMEKNAPVGVAGLMGGGLSNNIGVTYTAMESAEIKPTDQVPYADAVETGSQPHIPPAGPDSALAQWCELKGLNVWAVAKSIARKGTKPHPYIEPTYQAIKPQVTELFTRGIGQYIEGLGI
jgi:hypothetical protein